MVYQTAQDSTEAHAIAGPFTLREAVVIGGGLLLLLGSVLPFQFGGLPVNIWVFNGLVFNQLVSLALPVLVAGAFAWRRLTGRTRVMVGSLTLDQAASVVAVLTVLYFFLGVVLTMNASFLVGFAGALALLAGTTAASVIPGFAQDFQNGQGHVLTRPIRPAKQRAGRAASGDAEANRAEAPRSGAVAAAPGSGRVRGADPAGKAAAPAASLTASEDSPMPAQDASAWQSAAASPGAPTPTSDQPARGQARADAVPAFGGSLPSPGTPDDSERTTSDDDASPRDDASLRDDATAPEDATALGDVVPRSEATPSSAGGAEDARQAEPALAAPVARSAEATTDADARGDEEPAPGTSSGDGATPVFRDGQDADDEPFEATRSGDEAPAYQAFWFAVPRPREVVDERSGRQVFTAEPGAWILALEDRGDEFLVQDTDGRVGVLRDLTNVERA